MPTGPRVRSSIRADVAAAFLCGAIGLGLAVAPHLAMWFTSGSLVYLGDGDDVFYLSLSRAPYRGELTLSDPFQPADSPRATLYPPLPFVPTARFTQWIGVDRLLIPLVWRVLGGILLGLSVFAVFRVVLAGTKRPVSWALGCSLIAIADSGFVGGQTLFGAVGLVAAMFRGETPMNVPNALGQFRVVTPLLNLPALLGLAAIVVPPLRERRRTWIEVGAGALLLGLCIHLYFFFWTAAVLALSLCFILDRLVIFREGEAPAEPRALNGLALFREGEAPAEPRARVAHQEVRPPRIEQGHLALARKNLTESRFLVLVLLGGIALGTPQLLANSRAFSDPSLKPILHRTNRGRVLATDDPARVRYLVNLWAFAKLAFGGTVVFGFLTPRRIAKASIWEGEAHAEPEMTGGSAGASPSRQDSSTTTPGKPRSLNPEVNSTRVESEDSTSSKRIAMGLSTILAFTVSGFLLLNSAIVTRLEFENFHWIYVHAPFGEILVLSGAALVLDRWSLLAKSRFFWALPVAIVALATIWRPYESLRNPEAVRYTSTLRSLIPLRSELATLGRNDVLAGRWPEVNVALLLTDSGLLYQYNQTIFSTLAPLNEIHERKALNAWINDLSMSEYLDEIGREEVPFGPEELQDRKTIYRELLSGKAAVALLKRYRPTHLIRREALGKPPADRGGPWNLVANRAGWALWRRGVLPSSE